MERSEAVPEPARRSVEATVAFAREVLGDRMRSLFAVGSSGYGGYSPGWSDIDLDVVVTDGTETSDQLLEWGYEIRKLAHAAGHTAIDVKCYSIAILNDERTHFEYGSANRAVMLLDSAVLVVGDDVRSEVLRPSRARLVGEGRRLLATFARNDDTWWSTRPLDDTAALLALPGRLLLTAATGRVGGKLEGLTQLTSFADELPPDVWPWIAWAIAVRTVPSVREVPPRALDHAREAARRLVLWAGSKLHAVAHI